MKNESWIGKENYELLCEMAANIAGHLWTGGVSTHLAIAEDSVDIALKILERIKYLAKRES